MPRRGTRSAATRSRSILRYAISASARLGDRGLQRWQVHLNALSRTHTRFSPLWANAGGEMAHSRRMTGLYAVTKMARQNWMKIARDTLAFTAALGLIVSPVAAQAQENVGAEQPDP